MLEVLKLRQGSILYEMAGSVGSLYYIRIYQKVISMHCPSGPISLLTSAHVTSAIQAHLPLEHAIDEVEWRKELLLPSESINNGNYILSDNHGLGSTLDKAYINFNGNIWKE